MTFEECFETSPILLMEGALGERLRREYHVRFDPAIAMAALVEDPAGRHALGELWSQYREIARRHGMPLLATTPTRRANRARMEWAGRGEELILQNVRFLQGLQAAGGVPMYVGGLLGCRGDAYTGEGALPEQEAEAFHSWAAQAFAHAGADFLYAGIMPALPEALGMARAMAGTGLPYIISFTVERSGCLVDGTPIARAIETIDGGVSRPPVCYMANCVHPDNVLVALEQPFNRVPLVRRRFLGLQANTSPLPYSELDGAADLHSSAPRDFAAAMVRLQKAAGLKIMGGCCGTDDRHMEAMAAALSK